MFLDRIVTQTRLDLQQRKQEQPLETVMQLAHAQPEPRDLFAALQSRDGVRLIAEVKRASPSKGMLAPHMQPVELARTYENTWCGGNLRADGTTFLSRLTRIPDRY